MRNKKYTATKKNEGNIPSMPVVGYTEDQSYDIIDQEGEVTQVIKGSQPIYDDRIAYIEVPCGNCIECRKKKAREWQVRLAEELKDCNYPYFVTLTFAPKELQKICDKTHLKESNAVAEYALRHCLERYRKDHKKSLKHWLITELGHEGTERIHMHGILFSDNKLDFGNVVHNNLRTWKYWKYGHIYVGDYVNNKTINYISKYITKIDTDHKGFVGTILASPGIGKGYIEKMITKPEYRPHRTIDYYRLNTGVKVKLPTYYKNKLFNEEDREKIWRDYLDMNTVSIAGNTYSKNTCNNVTLDNITEKAKEMNKFYGYGDTSKEWRKKDYNITKRMMQQVEKDKQLLICLEKLMNEGKITKDQEAYYYKLQSKMTKLKKNVN